MVVIGFDVEQEFGSGSIYLFFFLTAHSLVSLCRVCLYICNLHFMCVDITKVVLLRRCTQLLLYYSVIG